MTAPRLRPHQPPRLVRLPSLDDNHVPAWRFVNRAVTWSLAVFATVVVVVLVGAALLTMTVTVAANGTLEPSSVWAVRSAEAGILTRVLVQTGDTVTRGQVVARLDSMTAEADVADVEAQLRALRIDLERAVRSAPLDQARAQASADAAEARVVRARTALRRAMAEFAIEGDPDSVAANVAVRVHVGLDAPSAELLAAQSDLTSAHAEVAAAELASFDIARKRADIHRLEAVRLSRHERRERQAIRAPASGVVLTDRLDQIVGESVTPGQPILEVADLTSWRATFIVAERDVYRVRLGDPVEVEVLAFASLADNRIRGHVVDVGWQPVGARSSDVATPTSASGYPVVVTIDAVGTRAVLTDALRRGFAVHGEIITRSASALAVMVEEMRARTRAVTR
jgi:multidrug resistance efflux pump